MCPGCGAEVRVGSSGCPKCNNLDPWEMEDNDMSDGLDLPDPDGDIQPEKLKIHPFWIITAILLLLAFLLLSLGI